MGRGGRVDDQALDVRDVRQQREDGEVVDELPGLVFSALDVKGEDGGAAVREVLLVEGVLRMVREGGVVHLLDQRMVREVLDDLFRVLRVPLQAERQGLHALEEQERVEGRDGGAGIPQEDGTDVGDKGCGADCVGKGDAVVTRVRVGDLREFARGFPVKFAGLDDDAAEGRAVAAEELCGGVDDDVSTVFDGPDEVRGAKGIVDDERDAVRMGQLRERLDVRDVGVRVAEGLDEDRFRIVLDGGLHFVEVMDVHE